MIYAKRQKITAAVFFSIVMLAAWFSIDHKPSKKLSIDAVFPCYDCKPLIPITKLIPSVMHEAQPFPAEMLKKNPLVCMDDPTAIQKFSSDEKFDYIFFSCDEGRTPHAIIRRERWTMVIRFLAFVRSVEQRDQLYNQLLPSSEEQNLIAPCYVGEKFPVGKHYVIHTGTKFCRMVCGTKTDCADELFLMDDQPEKTRLLEIFAVAK